MAKSEIHSVLQIVPWGTRLSLGLHDFSALVPSATNDIIQLAKEVNSFSLVLRQVGANLKEDGEFPSFDATQVVNEILQQSQMVFREVEHIVPFKRVRQEEDELCTDDDTLSLTYDWAWGENSRLKAHYLLGHLESLKLTLSVLLQCLYVAKITTWSHQQRTQLAIEAVSIERLQLQCLIIEQQMSLIRVYRVYQEYSLSKAAFPEVLLNQGVDLIQYDEREANPMALALYQESTLSKGWPATTETEDLKRVKRITRPYMEQLLYRWTRLDEIEQRLIEEGNDRGRWEQPFVESDSEDDLAYRRENPPNHSMGSVGPVLMPVNEGVTIGRNTPLPKAGVSVSPVANGHHTSPPVAVPIPRFFSTSNYSPSQINSSSLAPSPLSPRTSAPAEKPTTWGDSNAPHSEPSQQPAAPPGPAIPWRLKLNSATWDFHGESVMDSNTTASHIEALVERSAVTEIMAAHVSRAALDERGFAYQAVNKDVGNGGRTRFDICFVVLRPLSWSDVLDLVRLTEALSRREKDLEGRRVRHGQSSSHEWRDEERDDRIVLADGTSRAKTHSHSMIQFGKKALAVGGVAAILAELLP